MCLLLHHWWLDSRWVLVQIESLQPIPQDQEVATGPQLHLSLPDAWSLNPERNTGGQSCNYELI